MIDKTYLETRIKVLKDIKKLTGKDYSGQYPIIEIKNEGDTEGIAQCLIQIEKLERHAQKIAESIMH